MRRRKFLQLLGLSAVAAPVVAKAIDTSAYDVSDHYISDISASGGKEITIGFSQPVSLGGNEFNPDKASNEITFSMDSPPDWWAVNEFPDGVTVSYDGGLPEGLTLDSKTGFISGTPV